MPLSKTEKGQNAFKTRSADLSSRQRSAFILCDGKRSMADVLTATGGLGVTQEDLEHMLREGMLVFVGEEAVLPAGVLAGNGFDAAPMQTQPLTVSTSQERYQNAYPVATRLTAALGLRGFRLNLAVEAAGSYEALLELAPKIREAVGEEKFRPLGLALST